MASNFTRFFCLRLKYTVNGVDSLNKCCLNRTMCKKKVITKICNMITNFSETFPKNLKSPKIWTLSFRVSGRIFQVSQFPSKSYNSPPPPLPLVCQATKEFFWVSENCFELAPESSWKINFPANWFWKILWNRLYSNQFPSSYFIGTPEHYKQGKSILPAVAADETCHCWDFAIVPQHL